MRILVADISGPDNVRDPVAEFLGIPAGQPPPERLIWRGHEVIIRPGISIKDAEALKPNFVFALMGWAGVNSERSKFYEYFFNKGVPVFTWGDDSNIPKLMLEVKTAGQESPSTRIVFLKPDHPILRGVSPSDVKPSGSDYRRLVLKVRPPAECLAYDPDNKSCEIIYLEEWFGNHRWLHYHPYPCPPSKLIDNFLTYMTRPKQRAPLTAIGATAGGTVAGVITYLLTGNTSYTLGAALAVGTAGGALGWHFSE